MPKFTQTMTMHLNGGRKFSVLQYDILCDGKPTKIQRVTRTNGSPKYLKEVDEFVCGDDKFDVLANGNTGLQEWLEKHSA